MCKLCYLCGKEITSENYHYEHIIPNGIAGKLGSSDILDKNCGEFLGKEIDLSLSRKFLQLMNILDIKRDRGKNKASEFYTHINGQKIKCLLRDGKVTFAEVYVDEENKIIFCPKKERNNLYRRFGNRYNYTISLENPILFWNELVELTEDDRSSLVKIAVEFALYHNIPIKLLNMSFDYKNKKFKNTPIIPYFSINLFEKFIEDTRWFFEKDRMNVNGDLEVNSEFPTHTLHLFSVDNRLFCFISLFSFFEFYVQLSDQYYGPYISEWHIESVVKSTSFTLIYNLKSENPKDIDICARHFGESVESILEKIYKSKEGDPENGGIIKKEICSTYKKIDCERYMLKIAQDAYQIFHYYYISLQHSNEMLDKLIPLELKECLSFLIINDDFLLNFFKDALFLFYTKNDNDFFDLNLYKTYIRLGNGLIDIPQFINNLGELGEQNGKKYREQMLNKVIGSSELLYPSNLL